ncbi:hypothetical protein [Enhydrobacter sp.]|uniref:hypothetical protein n=1 Tax=Enhydrobacter sp. TaxID=1894999 RepID=UPI0026377503|nr:hypothetical protein [Enhydrobacter sp.]WIM09192.1 MAG: hypothetical protein OJF58_000143 [Enhydrobacter sp.]
MRIVVLAALLALLAACGNGPSLPTVSAFPNPDDPAAPAAAQPYRPVMAGTVYHGIGDRP